MCAFHSSINSFLEELASQQVQSFRSLTSVGDHENDILFEGFRASQTHFGTNLFHYIQGHLEEGRHESERVINLCPSFPGPRKLSLKAFRPSAKRQRPLQGLRIVGSQT